MVNKERIYSFRELYENVCRMALLYQKQGAQKGDRVIIYMPMVP